MIGNLTTKVVFQGLTVNEPCKLTGKVVLTLKYVKSSCVNLESTNVMDTDKAKKLMRGEDVTERVKRETVDIQ